MTVLPPGIVCRLACQRQHGVGSVSEVLWRKYRWLVDDWMSTNVTRNMIVIEVKIFMTEAHLSTTSYLSTESTFLKLWYARLSMQQSSGIVTKFCQFTIKGIYWTGSWNGKTVKTKGTCHSCGMLIPMVPFVVEYSWPHTVSVRNNRCDMELCLDDTRLTLGTGQQVPRVPALDTQ